MSEKYTIRHGSIAAVQYVKRHSDGVEVAVTDAKDGSEIALKNLPLAVQAAVNRQFGIVFSLPYASREDFVKNSIPFDVEAETLYELKLTANNGETATLEFNTYDEAVKMRESFMLTGQYSDAFVVSTCR